METTLICLLFCSARLAQLMKVGFFCVMPGTRVLYGLMMLPSYLRGRSALFFTGLLRLVYLFGDMPTKFEQLPLC